MILEKIGRAWKKSDDGVEQKKIRIYSWKKIFSSDVTPIISADEDALIEAVRAGDYSCLGKSHSFNGIQITMGSNCLDLAKSGFCNLQFDPETRRLTVSASNTIQEAKEAIRIDDKKIKKGQSWQEGYSLFNSGNYMQQTLIGALVTGTHGYGERPVMADAIVSLTFLDEAGESHTLHRDDEDDGKREAFKYVALSFGTIGPIVEVVLEVMPNRAYRSETWIGKFSQKEQWSKGAVATSYLILPYSDPQDPVMLLHCLFDPRPGDPEPKNPEINNSSLFSGRRFAECILRYYWALDRLFPWFRRRLHKWISARRWISSKKPAYHKFETINSNDMDFLYDPEPGLSTKRRITKIGDTFSSILQGMFSTTHTSYNLAFFVPLEKAPVVVRFIMNEAIQFADLGFYLKNLIGVRELPGKSDLPFAGNFKGPVVAIDLFADVRDYAWLERLEREVLYYCPETRPHWGKSAIVDEFRESVGVEHLEKLRRLHEQYYRNGRLKLNERVRRLLGIKGPVTGSPIDKALKQSKMPIEKGIGVKN